MQGTFCLLCLPNLRELDIPKTGVFIANDADDWVASPAADAEAGALAAALKALPSSLEHLDVSDVVARSPEIVDALSLHTALTYLSCDVYSHVDALPLAKSVLQVLPNLQVAFLTCSGELLPSELEDDVCEVMRRHKHLDMLELDQKRLYCVKRSWTPP